jgi:hypothetical protein
MNSLKKTSAENLARADAGKLGGCRRGILHFAIRSMAGDHVGGRLGEPTIVLLPPRGASEVRERTADEGKKPLHGSAAGPLIVAIFARLA